SETGRSYGPNVRARHMANEPMTTIAERCSRGDLPATIGRVTFDRGEPIELVVKDRAGLSRKEGRPMTTRSRIPSALRRAAALVAMTAVLGGCSAPDVSPRAPQVAPAVAESLERIAERSLPGVVLVLNTRTDGVVEYGAGLL